MARNNIAPQFFYQLTKDKLVELRDAAQPEMIATRLFEIIARDLDLWSNAGPFPRPLSGELFNRGFANPGSTKIRAYFNRFGYDTFVNDLAASLAADYQPTINMLDNLVNLRNQIAHGDLAATKTPADLQQMIEIVRIFCRSTDDVFARWCRASLCTIR